MKKYHLTDFSFLPPSSLVYQTCPPVLPGLSVRNISSFPHCLSYPSKYLSFHFKRLFSWFSHETRSISLLILVVLLVLQHPVCSERPELRMVCSWCRHIVGLYSSIMFSFPFSTLFLIISNTGFFGHCELPFLYSYHRLVYASKII